MSTTPPDWQGKPSGSEQRKSQRVPLITQVESTTNCEANSLGHSLDISNGGLLVLTSDIIEPRTEVIVRFRLPPYPRGPLIETAGLVVRVQPSKSMAIQFLDLKYWDRRAIEDFVQQGQATAA